MFEKLCGIVDGFGDFDVRVSRSQVALRRKRGFAYVWLPGEYLAEPDAEAVLSIALGRHDDSLRFKSVVRPANRLWMHHLEIHDLEDIDGDVVAWLREAFDHAG